MSEDPISSFCNALASFCNHLQSNSDALKLSIDRRPIPLGTLTYSVWFLRKIQIQIKLYTLRRISNASILSSTFLLDSASSTFLQSLNRRVSSASADLELLDSMSFGTVSFEELLGHCNELYKKNHSDLLDLEDRLKSYGYVPVTDVEEEEEEEDEVEDVQRRVSECRLDAASSFYGSLSMPDSTFSNLDDDALLDESMSLKKLGLSDACLATLASEADLPSQEFEKEQEFKKQHQPVVDKMVTSEGSKFLSDDKENLESAESPSSVLEILKSEFECLPAYIKGLATWEDLLVAVDKINSSLRKKTNEGNFFRQDEIPSFDLGPKARSYLLLLVRMNRLVVETIDGQLSYRVL